ncbi:MAG TPA: hypothetical protein VNP04_18775 [Alphaproteobacteria bacterium]|nr:hypothetical protein [Alphaproteobacteria bacterium]
MARLWPQIADPVARDAQLRQIGNYKLKNLEVIIDPKIAADWAFPGWDRGDIGHTYLFNACKTATACRSGPGTAKTSTVLPPSCPSPVPVEGKISPRTGEGGGWGACGHLLVWRSAARPQSAKAGWRLRTAGLGVERADTEELFKNPQPPYTKALFSDALPVHPAIVQEEMILTRKRGPPTMWWHVTCIRETEPG